MDVNKKNKRAVYFVFLLLCMFLVGCNEKNSDQNGEKEGRVENMDVEVFMSVKYGDSFENLKKQIGEPSCYDGNIKKYPVYELEDGGKARVLYFDDKILKINVEDLEGKTIYRMDKFEIMADLDAKSRMDYLVDCEGSFEIEDFDKLDWGYNYNDILLTIGDPTIIDGSGMPRYFYKLKDGTIVNVVPDNSNGGIQSIIHFDEDKNIISARYR